MYKIQINYPIATVGQHYINRITMPKCLTK